MDLYCISLTAYVAFCGETSGLGAVQRRSAYTVTMAKPLKGAGSSPIQRTGPIFLYVYLGWRARACACEAA